MANDRYFLGYTQTLSRARFVSFPGGSPPYSIEKQRERLLPQLQALSKAAADVPSKTTANGQVVAVVSLNPQALSRSAFPQALLGQADWRLLGSRAAWVKPEAGRGFDRDTPTLTTDLFVATTPAKITDALPLLMANARLSEGDRVAEDFCNIESVRLMSIEDRLKPGIPSEADDLELVLHYDALTDAIWRDRFTRFAHDVDVQLDPGLEVASRGLLFMTATATRDAARQLARFTFLRAIRPLPVPRPLEQPELLRNVGKKAVLPKNGPVDANVTIVIFDGGLPASHPFKAWVRAIEPPPHHDIGSAVPAFQDHGLAVTSAALFDSITPNVVAPRPYAAIDHYRVLGTNTKGKKGHYRALMLIDEILSQREYQFISMSLGPPEPIDNDTVSPWTTLLDDHIGDGSTLACVAVGNNGKEIHPACRVMAPSDSVNALGVGACNANGSSWERADYSALGPGRSPGLIKPDVLHFGGYDGHPYLCAGTKGSVLQTQGTSFATPGTIRIAAGIRAHFGSKLSPMVLKALLVHCAERDETKHPVLEVGWGRVPQTLERVALCPPGSVRVIYAGKLPPGGVLRAPILVPPGLTGNIGIRATLCYSCQTDPVTPGDYTRAGVDITFRPDATRFATDAKGKKSANPMSDWFFKQHDHMPEDERRLLAQKWNTVMHGERSKRCASLKDPCFDMHYIARAPGLSTTPGSAPEVHYALVVSVIQEKTADLYERVLAAFPKLVAAIQPLISIEQPIAV